MQLNYKIVVTGGSGRFGSILQKKYKSNKLIEFYGICKIKFNLTFDHINYLKCNFIFIYLSINYYNPLFKIKILFLIFKNIY